MENWGILKNKKQTYIIILIPMRRSELKAPWKFSTIYRLLSYGGDQVTADGECSHEIKSLLPGRKGMTNLDSIFKSRDITLPTKVCLVKAMVFPVWMYGWMWELDCEESWALKNWCFWTVVLEETLESPLDCKEIQPVHSEGDQPWDYFGGNDAKAETPVLWPPHAKSWLTGKDSDAGRDWGQEEKGMTEDEMAGWHHWLDGLEFEWTLGVGDGQGGLASCNSWGRKELDTTERPNWTELNVDTEPFEFLATCPPIVRDWNGTRDYQTK